MKKLVFLETEFCIVGLGLIEATTDKMDFVAANKTDIIKHLANTEDIKKILRDSTVNYDNSSIDIKTPYNYGMLDSYNVFEVHLTESVGKLDLFFLVRG